MVAIRHLLPDDPADRTAVETTLRSHPEAVKFVERFGQRVRSAFANMSISVDAQRFDPWDPPITLTIKGPMSDDDYVHRYALLRSWAAQDPDFDATLVHISLRSQSGQVAGH